MRMGQGKTQFSAGGEPTNRERILRVAVAAFGEHGYEGASTNQICADAGISKGLLFHYFKSKENLFMEVLERCRAEVAAAMEPVDASVPEEPLTALNNFYQRQLDFFSSHPHHYRIMVQLPQGHSALLEEFFRKERARFENALSLGLRLYLSRSPVRAGIGRLESKWLADKAWNAGSQCRGMAKAGQAACRTPCKMDAHRESSV